jgi:HTH-type transcriptional regulator / antitoxin HigA
MMQRSHLQRNLSIALSELWKKIEARELDETDLLPVLGTQSAIAEILENKRLIQQQEARKLAEFFHVDMSLFLEAS